MNSLCRRSVLPFINGVIVIQKLNKSFYVLPNLSRIPMTKLVNSNVIYPLFNLIHHKSKKAIDDDNDNEEDITDDDTSLKKDSKVIKFTTTSLRTDGVLKSAMGVSRNKIEELFYESKIRVNGKKILKKSAPVRPDYEIDVIKHVSPKNSDHLYVSRVEVLNIVAREDSIQFTVRRFRNLLIENYEEDPYKPGTKETTE